MDPRLIAWARAAAGRRGPGRRLPRLWLFTDARRLPDPRPAVARLPIGLGGVVLRHDGEPGRLALGRDLARICRARRLTLVVAGDARLAAALGAGLHLRGGRWPGPVRPRRGLVSSSAHGSAELHRARRAGADLVFLSPVFATASHSRRPRPGRAALEPSGPRARACRLPLSAASMDRASGGCRGASARPLAPSEPSLHDQRVISATVFRNCHVNRPRTVAWLGKLVSYSAPGSAAPARGLGIGTRGGAYNVCRSYRRTEEGNNAQALTGRRGNTGNVSDVGRRGLRAKCTGQCANAERYAGRCGDPGEFRVVYLRRQ